ncbi:protein ACCELERATED CELL DEATH 6-like [Rhododendron vialii]|uniref:protein ACCELERATED CELL DEATH 6-like n=1 Tax=Rhododendron vialii TaxID=182163 RepID=UPI00265DCA1E|nr:protein ACCELERATED CELL DEATH 6-like [Rhododendron vialii]
MVVAALIATITFAAAFAIPGGYDGNQGRHQGMAVLARATAFQAFVITNTVAMICSFISLFLCITGLWFAYTGDDDAYDLAIARYVGAVVLILVSMFFLMTAFIAATFAMLAHVTVFSVSTCIIACIPFIANILELRKFVSKFLSQKSRVLKTYKTYSTVLQRDKSQQLGLTHPFTFSCIMF